MFGAGGVASGISTRAINDGHGLMLFLDEFRNVSGDFDIVVEMSDDDEDVDLIADVRLRVKFGLLGSGDGY